VLIGRSFIWFSSSLGAEDYEPGVANALVVAAAAKMSAGLFGLLAPPGLAGSARGISPSRWRCGLNGWQPAWSGWTGH
jgi:hypothetical protein